MTNKQVRAPGKPEGRGLWHYSLDVYRRPGFARAAIALQDQYQMDVNLLLACLWAGNAGHLIDAETFRELELRCGPWRREVIEVFRELRRRLKGHEDQEFCRIRAGAKARELDSEEIQQERIQAILGPLSGQGSAAKAAENLKSYLFLLDRKMDKDVQELLARLLAIAFEGLSENEAVKRLG